MIVITHSDDRVEYRKGSAYLDHIRVNGYDELKGRDEVLGMYPRGYDDEGYERAKKALELLKNAEDSGVSEYKMPGISQINAIFGE